MIPGLKVELVQLGVRHLEALFIPQNFLFGFAKFGGDRFDFIGEALDLI